MIEFFVSKMKLMADNGSYLEFESCIEDLLQNEDVQSMKNFMQHSDINCLEHSIYVSYRSYLACKKLGLDYKAAARGGLLHDFFLYDWHTTKTENGLHGFTHPNTALKNANERFDLNKKEKDIIAKHMWPLTIKMPKYRESLIVSLVDTYCALTEISSGGIFGIRSRKLRELDNYLFNLLNGGLRSASEVC